MVLRAYSSLVDHVVPLIGRAWGFGGRIVPHSQFIDLEVISNLPFAKEVLCWPSLHIL